MTLDQKLVRLRKKEGLSQADVSEKLNVSRQAVTKWETGGSRPSTRNLQSLSKLYSVPLEYLLDEKEDELPAISPVGPSAEHGTEQKAQRTKWIRRSLIVVLILALVICCIFLYLDLDKREESYIDLSEMPIQETVPSGGPEFDLYWE